MNFKYLALGILVGYLAPYAIALIKAKKDSDSLPNCVLFTIAIMTKMNTSQRITYLAVGLVAGIALAYFYGKLKSN